MNNLQLHNYCNASIKTIREWGQFVPCTRTSGYTFIDNQSRVLGVAHIDTVLNSRLFKVQGDVIISPRLDDRLGLYTLLYALPQAGINLDLLLCEDEEIGRSTAQYFTPSKQYSWIVEFDRHGNQVVMYQYDSPENRKLLSECGLAVGVGTFSDICWLDGLNCVGFNFGVSYFNEHTLNCYMHVPAYETMLTRFTDFYNKHKYTHLPYAQVFSPDLYDEDWILPQDDYCAYCGTWYDDEDNLISLAMDDYCTNCAKFLDP
jgi:hypothetical protein